MFDLGYYFYSETYLIELYSFIIHKFYYFFLQFASKVVELSFDNFYSQLEYLPFAFFHFIAILQAFQSSIQFNFDIRPMFFGPSDNYYSLDYIWLLLCFSQVLPQEWHYSNQATDLFAQVIN